MVKLSKFDEATKNRINWCAKCRHDRNREKKVCAQLKVHVKDAKGKVVGHYYDMTLCNTPDNSVAPNKFVPRR